MTTTAARATEIKPLGDRVLVRPVKQDEKTRGGIFLPDTAKERPQIGEVIAVGPGKVLDNGQRTPVDLKVGDRVVYSKFGGSEVKLDTEELLILNSNDVLTKLA